MPNFIEGTPKPDTLVGTDGDDIITDYAADGWDSSDDTLSGLGGNDSLIARNGRDTLIGGDGNDTMEARSGGDWFEGGAGNDTINGRPEGVLNGTTFGGDDFAFPAGNYADGGAGDDKVGGGRGSDILIGGEGNDTLLGLEGEDTLTGGAGNDLIRGFSGTDTVVFSGARSDYAITEHPTPNARADVEPFVTRPDIQARPDEYWSYYRQFTDLRAGSPDGTDTVAITGFSEVELVQFSDGTLTWEQLLLPCYVRGTAIRTPTGDVPVEALRAGDLVTTPHGDRPLIWVGQRHVAPYRHPEPRRALPIRIRAGALADGLPYRDLLVSPSHALLIDGQLVHAEALVNGATIAQHPCPEVTYHHIELASHDTVLAEGAAAETYLDDGNRGLFGPVEVAPPGPAIPCATVMDRAASAAVMRRLSARAEALGWRQAPAPAVLLMLDGKVLRPQSLTPGEARFRLPTGGQALLLLSPCARLGALDSADGRLLGLALTRLDWNGATLGADDPRLLRGWHRMERSGAEAWRWTDGMADLTAALGPALADGGVLGLRWRGACPGWMAPVAAAQHQAA